eukprot:SAG22_NODE_144_length_17700_cov_21.959207_5_plen_83_part_00
MSAVPVEKGTRSRLAPAGVAERADAEVEQVAGPEHGVGAPQDVGVVPFSGLADERRPGATEQVSDLRERPSAPRRIEDQVGL